MSPSLVRLISTGNERVESPAKAEDFKAAFRNHPAGVSIISADIGGKPVGLTASSVVSVSAAPAILIFSLSAQSSAAKEITQAETVVVHLLGVSQLALAKKFATSGADKFSDTSTWTRLTTGEPVLSAANAWLRGRIIDQMHVGGSTVVTVQVVQVQLPVEKNHDVSCSRPLVYHDRCWHSLNEDSMIE